MVTQIDVVEQMAVPEERVNRAMKAKEQAMEDLFQRQAAQKQELRAMEQQMRKPLLAMIDGDPDARAQLQELREISQRQQLPQLHPPKVLREYQRVSTTPIGITRVPPFDNRWPWSTSQGDCEVQVNADNQQGDMSFLLSTLHSHQGSAQAIVAVGIQLSPVANGTMHVWANPAYSYRWVTNCNALHAESHGWIGLHVDSYDLVGGLAGSPVDQQIHLWDNGGWASGGSDSGSVDAYSLSANFFVDTDHHYIVWVRVGGSIEADGSGWFGSNSSALATMAVTVPSIAWELG